MEKRERLIQISCDVPGCENPGYVNYYGQDFCLTHALSQNEQKEGKGCFIAAMVISLAIVLWFIIAANIVYFG